MANILLAEDDESVRGFVARALEMSGHTVTAVCDGEEAYDVLAERDRGTFDLLLSDIKMPFMDGIELAHLAAGMDGDLKILLMTGFADQRERADSLQRIVVDVVSKPFTLATIRKAVAEALDAPMLQDMAAAS